MTTPSKNHHGFIVTSPTGSVSLRDLPVPVHESRTKAARWAKNQGKPFAIVPAAQFYRTAFGKQVRALTQKKILSQSRLLIGKEEIEQAQAARRPNKLTALLTQLREKRQQRDLDAKIASDTRKKKTVVDPISRQLRETGETLDNERKRLADKSFLLQAMAPPKDGKIHRASDSDLAHLFSLRDPLERLYIDQASKFSWSKLRVNKLVKSGTIPAILTLFRAGKLPERMRTNKKLLKEINK